MASKELPIKLIPSELKPIDKRINEMKHKDTLPVIPSNICVLGMCGSGKSCFVYSLLKEGYVDSKGKSIFDEACIFLGAMDANKAFQDLPIENCVVLNEFDPVAFEAYIEDLKEHQMERLEKGKPRLNCLLLFDDFVGKNVMKPRKGKNTSIIEHIMLTSRHELNMTVIYCSQVYKTPTFTIPSVRNNINYWVLYQMGRREMMKFAEEHSGQFTPQQFVEWYDHCMRKKHNFIMVNYKKPITERYTERFSEVFNPHSILDEHETSSESSSEGD